VDAVNLLKPAHKKATSDATGTKKRRSHVAEPAPVRRRREIEAIRCRSVLLLFGEALTLTHFQPNRFADGEKGGQRPMRAAQRSLRRRSTRADLRWIHRPAPPCARTGRRAPASIAGALRARRRRSRPVTQSLRRRPPSLPRWPRIAGARSMPGRRPIAPQWYGRAGPQPAFRTRQSCDRPRIQEADIGQHRQPRVQQRQRRSDLLHLPRACLLGSHAHRLRNDRGQWLGENCVSRSARQAQNEVGHRAVVADKAHVGQVVVIKPCPGLGLCKALGEPARH
jgi:hypothetical protein